MDPLSEEFHYANNVASLQTTKIVFEAKMLSEIVQLTTYKPISVPLSVFSLSCLFSGGCNYG